MYFDIVQQAAKSGLFDIIGHIDLIKKFRIWPEHSVDHLYEETVKTIAENNLVVELNTSGVDRPCREFFPNEQIIGLLRKYEIPMTLGSDAHNKNQVGRHFHEAINLLKSYGYKELYAFKNRKKERYRI